MWLHRNYRGLTPFFSAWGLHKGLGDEAEREEGLGIMRELMAAEVEDSYGAKVGGAHEQREERRDDGDDDRLGGDGGGDKSWLDFSPGPGDKRNTKTGDINDTEKEGKGSNGNGYAALKGQGVRMKPRGDPTKERRKLVNAEEEEEGSDFF